MAAERKTPMKLHLERRYRFSASHLYWRSNWTPEKNLDVFGKCSFKPGHGHNYRLYLTVTGELDAFTGFLVDLGDLDRLVQEQVLDSLDHRHLNQALPEFGEGGRNPTTENLVAWIVERLVQALPVGVKLSKVRLEEDEDLAALWVGEAGL